MTIRSVAVIGAGTMGAGIAITALMAGFQTVLIDRAAPALDAARARITRHLARQAEKGRISADAQEAALRLLSISDDLASAAPADLVIEAVFEKLEIKTALLMQLEPLVRPDCLIATNTSCLRISEIARVLARPARFFGLHYFSPVEANPLVELVSGEASGTDISDRIGPFLTRTQRVVLPCGDRPGFAVNRFFCPLVNEAVRCHEEGLGSTAEIDAVACDLFGQPLGPFATTNMVGPAIMLHALENLAPLGAFYRPALALRDLVARGATWEIAPDAAGVEPARQATLSRRLRAALYLPLSDLLHEGVTTAEGIATGAAHALRFAVSPLAMMQTDPEAAQLIAALRLRYGTT